MGKESVICYGEDFRKDYLVLKKCGGKTQNDFVWNNMEQLKILTDCQNFIILLYNNKEHSGISVMPVPHFAYIELLIIIGIAKEDIF